jgi:hypothetical protein
MKTLARRREIIAPFLSNNPFNYLPLIKMPVPSPPERLSPRGTSNERLLPLEGALKDL